MTIEHLVLFKLIEQLWFTNSCQYFEYKPEYQTNISFPYYP